MGRKIINSSWRTVIIEVARDISVIGTAPPHLFCLTGSIKFKRPRNIINVLWSLGIPRRSRISQFGIVERRLNQLKQLAGMDIRMYRKLLE
jgi:hypothetical protein